MSWYEDWESGKGMSHSGEAEYYSSKKSYTSTWVRCWDDHKPIKISNGEVLGAARAHPQKGYDIYIGLDYGMQFQTKNWPWQKNGGTGPVEFLFPIPDMSVPKDVKNFKKMIVWMLGQLDDGKRIQVGCIGGHGRTGLVLAALVQVAGIAPRKAIQWVRKHHCKKAVESESQVKFLVKHYKVESVAAVKGTITGSSERRKGFTGKGIGLNSPRRVKDAHITAVRSKGSIW